MSDQPSTFDWAVANLAGTYSNMAEITERLKLAATHCHLIGGAAITPLKEGYDVQIVVIPINLADTYEIKMKKRRGDGQQDAAAGDGEEGVPRRGIGGATIFTIAEAAAVEWAPPFKLDDGSDARYQHYRVRGRYTTVDGTVRTIEGERDSDLRDNSDQIANETEGQVAQLRKTIVRSTITKAMLRGLRRAFGLQQGMPVTELHKPFVLARQIFTGRSADPETRRLFAQVIAAERLAVTGALYGGGQSGSAIMAQLQAVAPLPALPSPTSPARVIDVEGEVQEPPSPVGTIDPEAPIDGRQTLYGQRLSPASGSPPPAPPPPAPAPPAPAPPAPATPRAAPPKVDRPATWPWSPRNTGEPKKGTPLAEVPAENLKVLLAYYRNKRPDDPYAAANKRLVDEVTAILERKEAAAKNPDVPPHAQGEVLGPAEKKAGGGP